MRSVKRGWSLLALALAWSSASGCSDRGTAARTDQTGAGADGAISADSGGGGTAGTAAQTGGRGGTGAVGGAGGTGDAGGLGGAGGAAGSTDAGDASGGDEPLDGGAPHDAGRDADAAVEEPPDETCLAGITDYKATGPFVFEAQTWDRVKAWVPEVPAGCRVPIVHMANGGGATCMAYQGALEHLASHGFLTLCYESTNTGPGRQCLTAVELAETEVPDLISKKIGFAGHHIGGVSALLCAYRAKLKWGADRLVASYANAPPHGNGTEGSDPPWPVAYASIDSPVFMANNTEGGLVSERWVGDALDHIPATTELYWYKAVGAVDVVVPIGHIQESAVTWFRWKLLGDRAACEHFKALPDGDDWDFRFATSPTECE